MSRKKFVAGNWKMNLTVSESQTLAKELHQRMGGETLHAEVVVAPTHLSLYAVLSQLQSLSSPIRVASQNTSFQDNGAYTGEISTSMLKDLNVPYCIVGHSERRAMFGDDDKIVNKKIIKLWDTGITPIFCVGETLAEREADRWQEVIHQQIELGLHSLSLEQAENTIIAYEPVWAIGTGVSASPEQIQEVHVFIRELLRSYVSNSDNVTLLYGGSINPGNAQNIFSQNDVDGGLVGGASLKADDFIAIIRSLQ